jgi:UDP-N-acetylmuramoylalanine--D-glutamate ligase
VSTYRPFTVVIGLGPTGLACVRYLVKRGFSVAVTDSREHPPCLDVLNKQFPEVEVVTGQLSEDLIQRAEQLVISPGVSRHQALIEKQVKRGVSVFGDIELFARENTVPVLAITGSNGKTTVTTILAQMVARAGYQARVCGNIGQQALELLDQDKPDFYVMELSSFQLETTFSLKPKAAVILNVSPDHMDRYDDLDAYRAAKQNIYRDCEYAVVNADEPENWSALALNAKVIPFTLQTPKENQFGLRHIDGGLCIALGDKKLLSTSQLQLQGQHHFQNALAALSMGYSVGLSMEAMSSVLQAFSGIPHRCQLVAEKNNVQWINDSKGTNAGASVAAIQSLGAAREGQLLLIAGGDAKQADLTPLRDPVSEFVSQVYLFGQDADALQQVLDGVAQCHRVTSLEEAVVQAAKQTAPGDVVLFSPACASFDMFDNYEHRGQVFMDLVKAL